ncbi:hypothetical protein KIN20_031099 [Parelaphostrongylus tenuis]|uniref:SCP domain-containing protein n=1 Tax=Parelaphostrongylus tenuis TaxID=148309 RepID=A0AAD5R4P6_PARTN|nr:hypothetical protein KIN20_031099 [Parelaphostrongylus tenuis]
MSENVDMIIEEWWKSSTSGAPLVNLTPTTNNRLMIPFLQMANAATTTVGCGYTICDQRPRRFVSFVCQYGEPHVNIGVPIYKEGAPCSNCNKSCIFSLCDNEAN